MGAEEHVGILWWVAVHPIPRASDKAIRPGDAPAVSWSHRPRRNGGGRRGACKGHWASRMRHPVDPDRPGSDTTARPLPGVCRPKKHLLRAQTLVEERAVFTRLSWRFRAPEDPSKFGALRPTSQPLPLRDVQTQVNQRDTEHREYQPQRRAHEALDEAPEDARRIEGWSCTLGSGGSFRSEHRRQLLS